MDSNYKFKINLTTIKHLALRLNFDQDLLQYYSRKKTNSVKEIALKQVKNGKIKERHVFNTSKTYKSILKSINKNLLRDYKFPIGICGAIVGKSIDDMVYIHSKKEAIFSLDLKDFFPGIESGRIFNFFKSSGCNNEIAGIITDLVTFNDMLPQGFPTSPMLANIIAVKLDLDHLEICNKNKLSRTRWIDDIVISGRTKDLVPNISKFIGLIKQNNFRTSNRKTNFKQRSEEPTVLGLNVSKDKPVIPKIIVQKVEDLLLECQLNGIESVQELYNSEYLGRTKNFQYSLKGKLDYIEKYNYKEAQHLKSIYNNIFTKLARNTSS